MIKCAGLYTCEMDEPEIALAELQAQLNEKIELLPNTIGIVMCHADTLESGVFQHVAKNFPFKLVGATTSGQVVGHSTEDLAISIFVITSDTTRFETVLGGDVSQGIEKSIHDAFTPIVEKGETPKLIIAFPPLNFESTGDDDVDILGKMFPGVPIFGGQPTTDEVGFTGNKTLYTDKTNENRGVFLLCFGDINPRFIISALPEKDKLPHTGKITSAERHIVHEINGINVRKYLQDVEYVDEDGEKKGLYWFLPFLVEQTIRSDYDGIPVVRGLAKFTDEGSASFLGKMDESSNFHVMTMTNESVMAANRETLKPLTNFDDINGVLVFSCVARHMLMIHTSNVLQELTSVASLVGDAPFMGGYLCGEICPTSKKNEAYINRFHNYSLIAMVL
ncbi:MAG: FIST C-terminal domain-containing protein [Defluviitaleaceae bacterium]|nr:FIST C-terminal domain-containing protein [Defluviitaleaceae bacterium]